MVCPARTALLLAAAVAVPAAAQSIIPFTNEAATRGVSYTLQNYPTTTGYYGFGCGFADLDQDGDEDLVALGRVTGQVGVFENLGGGSFTNRSATSGIPNLPQPSGFCAADFDGDGDTDLFLTQTGATGNKLYLFEAGFTFVDATAAAGFGTNGVTKGCSAGDYDGDGWVDIYTCNYMYVGNPGAERNNLWHNNGDGTFTDVAPLLGVDDDGDGLQSVWTDFDRDGDLDLYLSNDRGMMVGNQPNKLWRNDDGVLVSVGPQAGVDVQMFSMGLACGDINGDGRSDFYNTNTTDLTPPLNGEFALLLSTPKGTFVQSQSAWGVAHPSTTWGWGCLFFDWNNDGDLDLYVNNQFSADSLFDNQGAPPMLDVAVAAAVDGPTGSSYSSAVGDIDNDGDLDLLASHLNTTLRLYVNHEGETRHWVKFRVIGSGHNTAAVGAAAEVTAGGVTQWRESHAGGNGYLSQNDLRLHFGLGGATSVSAATVQWPSGGPVRELTNVPGDTIWTLWPPEKMGDSDNDGDRDAADVAALCGLLGAPVTPGMERLDMNGDWVLDRQDAALLHDTTVRPGDLDGDGVVSGGDLGLLLGSWSSADCMADLDGSGVVGGSDLALMLGNWG